MSSSPPADSRGSSQANPPGQRTVDASASAPSTSSASATPAAPPSASRRRPRPPSFGTASTVLDEGNDLPSRSRSRTRAYGQRMLTAFKAAGTGGAGDAGPGPGLPSQPRAEVVSETASEKKRRRTGEPSRGGTLGVGGAVESPKPSERGVHEPKVPSSVETELAPAPLGAMPSQEVERADIIMADAHPVDAEAVSDGKQHPREIVLDDVQALDPSTSRDSAGHDGDTRLPIPTSIIVPAPSELLPAAALSPSIVPLTTTHDPLLDDRLRMLSTIRDVLGEDVVRSLPAVREGSLRRLSAEGVELDAMGLGGLTRSPPPEAVEGTGTTSSSHPDTAATMTTLDSAPSTEVQSASVPSISATAPAPILHPLGAPVTEAASPSAPPPPLSRSRSQLRNVAGRLSGWFGRSDSSSSSERVPTLASSTRSPSAGSVPLIPPAPASSGAAPASVGAAPAAAPPPNNQLQHVQQGPMMVVQGWPGDRGSFGFS